MSYDVGAFGIILTLFASVTYPQGVQITEFADDADAVDSPAVQIADKGMGVNGDMVTWAKAVPTGLLINVIANGEDDQTLQLLFDNNRANKGRRPVRDVISGNLTYPDGTTRSLTAGKCTDYVPITSVASTAKMKSKPYTFAFETVD